MDEKEFEIKKYELDLLYKHKEKEIHLKKLKFWIVSVGIGLLSLTIGAMINYQKIKISKNKNDNLFLQTFLDIIGNNDLEKKHNIAEFFSILTTDKKTQKHWKDYLDSLNIKIAQKYYYKDSLIRLNYKDAESRTTAQINNKIYQIDPFVADDYSISELEYLAFQNILNEDIFGAINLLNRVMSINPTYHNAYEIKKLLLKYKDKNNISWSNIYDKILSDYSWGMPEDIKEKMEQKLN